MLPGLEEALIGAGAVLVTAGGAIYAARVELRGTLRAAITSVTAASRDIQKQIEAASTDVREQLAADREHRVWEKRATTYTDAIAAIRHEQKVRGIQFVATRIGKEHERPQSPVDRVDLEARMIAFSSPTVLTAQKTYVAAAQKFQDEFMIWQQDVEEARQSQELVRGGVIPQTFPRPHNSQEDLEGAREEADKLSDEVISLIRSELHGG